MKIVKSKYKRHICNLTPLRVDYVFPFNQRTFVHYTIYELNTHKHEVVYGYTFEAPTVSKTAYPPENPDPDNPSDTNQTLYSGNQIINVERTVSILLR